jgi:hypothetical protein
LGNEGSVVDRKVGALRNIEISRVQSSGRSFKLLNYYVAISKF